MSPGRGHAPLTFSTRIHITLEEVATLGPVPGTPLGRRHPLAAQLALATYRLNPAPETRSSLLSIAATPYATRLTGHTNTVTSVAFSPDGHTLATTSADATARLWDTSIDRVTTRLCDITPAITHSEWDYYLPGLTYKPPCPIATRSAE